uniref:Uncharacterized protein n=1 Tax=Phlebotomus papatasi TaxID=29031 RepID=A0A1B0DJ09_PHLPP
MFEHLRSRQGSPEILTLRRKYKYLVARGDDRASEWRHFKDFVFFDGIIAQTAPNQVMHSTTAEIPARTEESLTIRNVASAVDFQEPDFDTKVIIEISSDEENSVPATVNLRSLPNLHQNLNHRNLIHHLYSRCQRSDKELPGPST